MNESTVRNIRVQDRYDELMRIGRHGHYETMFQVVREETESLRQQLAAALAACKLKDEAIQIAVDYARDFEEADFLLGEEALAIQPDDSALKAWLGEPIAHVDEDDNNKWATLVDDLDIKFGTPLYSPKGMTK